MAILILVVFGLILGSFVNAFVWRHYQQAELNVKKEELAAKKGKTKDIKSINAQIDALSISKGRSMCTHCRHPLAPKDLIPVISYLWLRGKCRYCGKRIEDTPVAELLTAVFFAVSYVFWPLDLHGVGLFTFLMWLVFMVGFTALVLYDMRWFLLPHDIVLPLIGLAIMQVIIVATFYHGGINAAIMPLAGAAIIGGLFYILYKVSHEQWIGGGDITLGILLGLLAGTPMKAFMVIFIASLLGTFAAVPLLVSGRATRSTHLPFGPFLILGAVITVLFGDRALAWYTGPFLNWINSLFLG